MDSLLMMLVLIAGLRAGILIYHCASILSTVLLLRQWFERL
jgi:hypothetical protein